MSIILFVLAAAYFLWSLRARPGRESSPYVDGRGPAAETAEQSEQSEQSKQSHVSTDVDAADVDAADVRATNDDDVPARETGTSSSTTTSKDP
jgi:hypothetical protein